MCNSNCCCKNSTLKELAHYLITFTAINMILCIIAIFIWAAKTERYKQALIYLDERNSINSTFKNTTYKNCRYGGHFKDDIYCEIEGKF